jgi:hypothetical protein
MLAYVDVHSGPYGIYLLPVLHPAISDPEGLLLELLAHLPGRLNRPLYLAVRSYQAGLEYPLEKLGCQPGQRSVLMVKHLALAQRALVYNERHIVGEKSFPEPTTPIMGARSRVEEPNWLGRLN